MSTCTAEKIRVIVLAGRRPEGDPVADMFHIKYKAAAHIGGRAMLNRVIDALDASGRVSEFFILTQSPEDMAALGDFEALKARRDVTFVASGNSICGSIVDFLDQHPSDRPTLVTTCDHVLLRGSDVIAFLDSQPLDTDIAVGLVPAETVLAKIPTARRTWLKFARGAAYTTCNLFLLKGPRARAVLAFWAGIEHNRKRVWRLAWYFGPMLFIAFGMRLLSLDAAFRRASRSIGATVSPVILKEARLSIDVDKPSDVEVASEILDT